MLRSAQILSVITSVVVFSSTVELSAQSGRASVADSGQPSGGASTARISPELAKLLTDWSRASDQIKTLHGKHTRRVYDTTFAVEKISTGEVWFEAPDKGRIDIKAVEVSDRMQAARQQEGAKVQRDSKGVPYKLVSDAKGKWICDGQRVFDIKDEEKRADVVNLPPTLRGKEIMNSPLPFLFGMPPEKAAQRFSMEIAEDYRPQHPYVKLKALPRLKQDAENWSQAEILLSTKTFLPSSVKLLDPGAKSSTVYTFEKVEVNAAGIFKIFQGSPWKPNLRGYAINVIQQQQQTVADGANGQPGAGAQMNVQKVAAVAEIPNVIGMSHADAKQKVLNAGIPESRISMQRGGPAQRPADVYKVRDQLPKPGSKLADFLRSKEKFRLAIYEQAKQLN